MFSPKVKKEEELKLFLERKYSEKKIVSPRKTMSGQSSQTTEDIVQQLEETTQQLDYIKVLYNEKDIYFNQQINMLKYKY